ncbi:hypothetical protein SASPL_114845 [Salvia splendens]|uniref:Uncharacterized protein n=1 Tax=Salvia splendens TaxID=180675 RepID=A0A8X8ZZR1_SALSN|nr:hypothetical protein SASPL_114845 [Salvia splendens]
METSYREVIPSKKLGGTEVNLLLLTESVFSEFNPARLGRAPESRLFWTSKVWRDYPTSSFPFTPSAIPADADLALTAATSDADFFPSLQQTQVVAEFHQFVPQMPPPRPVCLLRDDENVGDEAVGAGCILGSGKGAEPAPRLLLLLADLRRPLPQSCCQTSLWIGAFFGDGGMR